MMPRAVRRISAVVASAASIVAAAPAGAGEIRLNQVGFAAGAAKTAVYLSEKSALPSGTRFIVRDAAGKRVFAGRVGARRSGWNAAYPASYGLDFSALDAPGRYAIEIGGKDAAVSPAFSIAAADALYAPLLANALFFHAAQRDGADVDPSVLSRKPSHLADRTARIFLPPIFEGGKIAALRPVGGRRDVAGGWFDAGDYLKFVETASYVDLALYLAARDFPSLPDDLRSGVVAEADFGADWLLRMWDQPTRTLYYQVGTGQGVRGGFLGDHDLWRLPQKDDRLAARPDDPDHYLKHRPVFRAGPPGSRVSPNLAGRLAASFALCAMVRSGTAAGTCAQAAQTVFSLADDKPEGLLSTAPHNYYPENVWQDDLELGAVELHFLAKHQGNAAKAAKYLREAAAWAKAYVTSRFGGGDTLNLYDVAPLAHLELIRALDEAGNPQDLAVSRDDLVREVRSLLRRYSKKSENDPFGSGWPYGPGGYDFSAHMLGLAVTARLFELRTGDAEFAAFADAQRDVMLGRNAWGTSFIVGAGSVFPTCLHHQIANLAGSLGGKPPILLGAVVNGPSTPEEFEGMGRLEGQRRCPAGGGNPFAAFDGRGSKYVDDTGAWASVEPAIDYTALSVLLFATLIQ